MGDGDKQSSGRLWLIALFLLVAVFFAPALEKTFIFRDAFNLFYPYKAVEAEYLRSFSVCLWNPYETMGSSFVGELATGWFYPGSVFYMLFPVDAAFRLFIVSHYFLAALFMWLWLRSIRVGPAAAVCGSLTYSLSGYMLTQNGMPDMLATCAWTPGTLWLLTVWMQRRSLSYLVLFGASLSMPLLAGRAEGVILNGLAAAGWIIISDLGGQGVREKSVTLIKTLPLAGVVALALAMVQFLPSYELGKLSVKGGGFDLATATLWSLHPLRLIELVLASPFGRFWPEQDYTASALTGWPGHFPWSLSHYLGLLALIGALAAWRRGAQRVKWLALGALVLSILLSFGDNFILYPLAHKLVPPFRVFRYPEKFMALAALILAASGSVGLGHMMEDMGKGVTARQAKYIAALVAILSLVLVIIFAAGPGPPPRGGILPPPPDQVRAWRLSLQFGHAAGVIIALCLVWMASRWLGRIKLRGAALVAIVFLDLGLANQWIIPYADKEIYEFEPAALTIIREHADRAGLDFFDDGGRPVPGRFRVMREPEEPAPEALMMLSGASKFERYRRYERHTLRQNFNFIHGIEDLTGYTAAATADFDRVMREQLNQRTMELFNVRYAISPGAGSNLEGRCLPVAGSRPAMGFKVFELPGAFPRAYLIGRSRRVERAMDEIGLLASHDFRSEVVIEEHESLPPVSDETDLALAAAEVIEYTPHRVRIRTNAAAPAYLVLSDSYYPGWNATVDGRAAPVLRANFLARAVWTPAGEHTVEFGYRPALFRAGRLISIAAVVVIFSVLFFEAWFGRWRNRESRNIS